MQTSAIVTAGHPVGTPLSVDLTRRRLLELSGAAVLGAMIAQAWPLSQTASAPAGTGAAAPHLLRSGYAGLVGQRFAIAAGGASPLSVRLVEIRDLGRAAPGHEDAFALRFHGPRAPRLEQAVHELRHSQLGRFHLLLAPSGTGRRGQDYEAIINRLRPAHANG